MIRYNFSISQGWPWRVDRSIWSMITVIYGASVVDLFTQLCLSSSIPALGNRIDEVSSNEGFDMPNPATSDEP
jgi:hypothetical protein